MSYSAKLINKTLLPKVLKSKIEENNKKRTNFNRRNSPINTSITNNLKLTPNQDSTSIKNTKFPFLTENEFEYNDHPIKSTDPSYFENYLISKRKRIFKSPIIFNNKIISFQRQKDKNILEFPLFNDKLIFEDLNNAYLQDEDSDNGSDSSDEKIKQGKNFLYQELKNSSIELQKYLSQNQNNPLLSRKIRFKNE
jgi:hypothetical protein